jgi:hypothetical protein
MKTTFFTQHPEQGKLSRFLLAILMALLATQSNFAQSPCQAAGGTLVTPNLFTAADNGTFGIGSGAPNTSAGALPASVIPGYFYNNFTLPPNDAPDNGAYTVVNNVTTQLFGDWHVLQGHTTGANNDNFMIVNASGTPDVAFQQDIVLDPGKNYEFSVFAGNLNLTAPVLTNLTIETQDGFGIVPRINTGPMPQTFPNFDWSQKAFLFNTGPSSNMTFRIRNNTIGTHGNDFAVDDFTIMECINLPTGSVMGVVYSDLDFNNTQNGSEPGIANIEVRLIDNSNGAVVGLANSNGSGVFVFNNILVGNYTVIVSTTDPDLPAGYVLGTPNNLNVSVVIAGTATADFGFDPPCAGFTLPANGSLTVACPTNATQPTPPTIVDALGIPVARSGPAISNSPNPIGCEGTRVYIWTYSNCSGTQNWSYTYTIERNPFTIPANGAATVACPANATQPTPPTVTSNCGEAITPTGPTITNSPTTLTCEGTRTFAWTYTDCEGNSATWSYVYTIERNPFTIPANGAATVACPANAAQPIPPTVLSNCGEAITPTGPVVSTTPACEGTKTYTWTYTDCEGNSLPWVFTYTIERNNFALPANGAATVACPANATLPTPPAVTSNCGEAIPPTGPTVTNSPTTLTCEGTRTYVWTYTDCEGNSATWSYVYTIERNDFTLPPNASQTVNCPIAAETEPNPPVVTSNCGEVLAPVLTFESQALGCEGTKIYTYTYTDCEGNSHDWRFTYVVEYLDFNMPANESATAECPSAATMPSPPIVFDNCGKILSPVGPVISSTNNAQGCEGSRMYAWTYSDCEGNSHVWSKTFSFTNSADFTVLEDGYHLVQCLATAVAPAPPVLYDACGNEVKVAGPAVTESIASGGCKGSRTFSYVYTDCSGHSHPWNFTYEINDDQGPLGTCVGGNGSSGNISIGISNLTCMAEVPCPSTHDFTDQIEAMLVAGNYFDVCSGDNLEVTLDSYTDIKGCNDDDGDGQFTFGQTFYFRIADQCGNEYPQLCEITYSGACQPIHSFSMVDWGIEGGAPGNGNDLQLIQTLIGSNPIKIGGVNRSITINSAQAVQLLLPGTSGPSPLANCQQTNGSGCNQMSIGGMKNSLAANAVALELNLRYSVSNNNLTLTAARSQTLDCFTIHSCILNCGANGACQLRIFDANGVAHIFPFTLGGLQDLVNLYLNGNLNFSIGQKTVYGTALNQTLLLLNSYANTVAPQTSCNGIVQDFTEIEKLINEFGFNDFNTETPSNDKAISLTPNPTNGKVNLELTDLPAAAEVEMTIYNSLGQTMMVKKFGNVEFVSEKIDLTSLGRGIYMVVVKAGIERYTSKLVVQDF